MSPVDFPTRLSVAEARTQILADCASRMLAGESLAIEAAIGRFLSCDVTAALDLPPFANSAMDGFAVRGSDLPVSGQRRLRIVGTRLAGAGKPASIESGECLRITTGAALPDGADSVVIKERVSVEGDELVVSSGEVAGANVRAAGEDYQRGEMALVRGQRLRAAHLGLLAGFGMATVDVARQPRVTLCTTGDELIAPGHSLGPGQIHNTNRYTLGPLIEEIGAQRIEHRHLADRHEAVAEGLADAARSSDVIVTCGGVSAGEADFLPGVLAEIGRVGFWKVRMKPGMPFLFGSIGDALVFALPGNPVSAVVTFLVLVQPALAALQGNTDPLPQTVYARLGSPVSKRHDRAEYLRARLESRADGSLWATPFEKQGSGMLRSLVDADALLVVPEDIRQLATGDVVEAMPLTLGSVA